MNLFKAFLFLSAMFYLTHGAAAQTPEPTSESYEMLARIYELQANDGDAQAAYDLGFLYNSGLGVEQDLPRAFQWYLTAAKGGLLQAQDKVSMFYSVGVGTIRSDELAYFWILIAQYNGGQNLSSQMIRLEESMTAETRERAQRNARRCVESAYSDC